MNKQIKTAGENIKLLTHVKVQKVMDQIRKKQPIRVKDIYKNLNYEQSVTSAILSKIRRAKFVIRERRGKSCYYTIDEIGIKKTLHLFSEHFVKKN